MKIIEEVSPFPTEYCWLFKYAIT